MSIADSITIALLIAIPASAQVDRFIPTSGVVRVASMAARDEGYDPDAAGTYLDELRTRDGKEPYPGYASIGLYHNGHMVRSYSIRAETGDVVDPIDCKVFRYPDLLKFKRELMKGFGTKDVSLDAIASEIGCAKLDTVSGRAPVRNRHR